MKNVIATIVRGFMLGLGFTAAAVGVLYVAQMYLMSHLQTMTESGAASMITDRGEKLRKEIVLSDIEEQKIDGRVSVIGTLKNGGSQPAGGLQIEVDLFKKDKFVDQYSTYISGSVAPGESRHFKVACGCKDSSPAEHDSYKVTVRGGY